MTSVYLCLSKNRYIYSLNISLNLLSWYKTWPYSYLGSSFPLSPVSSPSPFLLFIKLISLSRVSHKALVPKSFAYQFMATLNWSGHGIKTRWGMRGWRKGDQCYEEYNPIRNWFQSEKERFSKYMYPYHLLDTPLTLIRIFEVISEQRIRELKMSTNLTLFIKI